MIYVFCATSGRGEQAERIVNNSLTTSSCHVILIVGGNEIRFHELSHKQLSDVSGYSDRIDVLFEPYSSSFSYATNAGWGWLRNKVGKDKNVLALATADDTEFLGGWYEAALNCYNDKFPEKDGLLFLNNISTLTPQNVGRTGACIVSAKFCDLYMGGWLVAPYYHCNGLDVEYAGVAEKYGRREFCPEAKIKHLMVDWERAHNSEQRLIGLATNKARAGRGWRYDIKAPWRHWK